MFYALFHSSWHGYCGESFGGDEVIARQAAETFAVKYGLDIVSFNKVGA